MFINNWVKMRHLFRVNVRNSYLLINLQNWLVAIFFSTNDLLRRLNQMRDVELQIVTLFN